MVKIGNGLGRRVRAVVTDMDMPLGRMIGNALEVKEAIDVLKGEGDSRLRKLCLVLASHMLALAFDISEEEAYLRAEESLVSGKALTQMKRHLQAQGGDERVAEDTALLPAASVTELITAPEDGYLVSMQAEAVGRAAMILGAGRKTKEDAIDHGAGIELLCQVGDRVTKGMPLAKFYTSRIETLSEATSCFLSALTIDSAPPEEKPLIHCVIGE
jgi:thymidine phosphorylase